MINNDIKKYMIRNSIVTYAMVIVTLGALFTTYKISVNVVAESRKFLYMVKMDGEVVPMEWVNRRENLEVEIKHHIKMFIDNFYTLEELTWKGNVEKALWLGDFKNLHIKRMNDGFYNRFMTYNSELVSTVYPENIELQEEDGRIYFKAVINLQEELQHQKINNILFVKGEIKIKERNFPYNPHGLYIIEFLEEKIVPAEINKD